MPFWHCPAILTKLPISIDRRRAVAIVLGACVAASTLAWSPDRDAGTVAQLLLAEDPQQATVYSEPTQFTGIAANQPPRYDLSAAQAISNDPNIRRQIAAAWAASNPNGPNRSENGFWICRNPDTGELFTRPFLGAEGDHNMVPGPPNDDAIAFFHTHPFPPASGARQGPSRQDERFAASADRLGIIRSGVGMYYFGPGLRPWQPQ